MRQVVELFLEESRDTVTAMTVAVGEPDRPALISLAHRLGGSWAAVGAKGLAAVSSFRPDVVLLDLMLPAVDGLSVLRTLRADPEWTALPIVVFSNSYSGQRLTEVWEAGATQVLAKASSTPKQVVEAVRATVAARTSGDMHQS